MYLRISCYCDACLNSSDLRVGVTTLLNTIQKRISFSVSYFQNHGNAFNSLLCDFKVWSRFFTPWWHSLQTPKILFGQLSRFLRREAKLRKVFWSSAGF